MAQDIIKNIPITLNIDARKRLSGTVNISLYSKDIETGQFEFTFIDEDGDPVALDETYSAQALVRYDDEEKTYLDDMVIEGNVIRFIFPHDFITKDGIVTMYIYITKDNYTSDVAAISFNVYRSEIDDIATDIVTTYDKNYEDILAEFEQTLEDYKLTLPQADSVRAEIDVILKQFGVDSQAKLKRYDTDAQQVIADNQTAFGLAESGRQATYEQAEDNRNQASNQAVADWNMTADALLETVEGNELARADAEATRKTAETDRVSSEANRKSSETTRVSNESERESAEDIRIANEVDRVNAENVRKANEIQRNETQIQLRNELSNETTHLNLFYAGTAIRLENSKYIIGSKIEGNNCGASYARIKVSGDIYYERVSVTVVNNLSRISLTVLDPSSSQHIDNPALNSEQVLTVLSKPNLGAPNLSTSIIIGRLNSGMKGDALVVNNMLSLNLTQTFGAGNEPSKEWMDRLIEQTGYFDEYILDENWQVGEMVRLDNTKANKVQEDWITPTLLNGWIPPTAQNQNVGYFKDEIGMVHVKGRVSSGNQEASIFLLPSEYRPSQVVNFPVICGGGTLGFAQVSTGGRVSLITGNNTYATLDSISFRAGV